jgi:hypothetical protein
MEVGVNSGAESVVAILNLIMSPIPIPLVIKPESFEVRGDT